MEHSNNRLLDVAVVEARHCGPARRDYSGDWPNPLARGVVRYKRLHPAASHAQLRYWSALRFHRPPSSPTILLVDYALQKTMKVAFVPCLLGCYKESNDSSLNLLCRPLYDRQFIWAPILGIFLHVDITGRGITILDLPLLFLPLSASVLEFSYLMAKMGGRGGQYGGGSGSPGPGPVYPPASGSPSTGPGAQGPQYPYPQRYPSPTPPAPPPARPPFPPHQGCYRSRKSGKSGKKTGLEIREKSGNPVSSQGISTLVREKYKIPLHK
ncbi:hypothetical protein J6590_006874 [Homalodisca vitripennis]|nr:hypothetical protein J6590_006874 [Homalodisca vitripennis]